MHTLAVRPSARVSLVLAAWFAVVVVATLTGVVAWLGPPAVGACIVGGVGLGLSAHSRAAGVRAWVERIPLRALVLYQGVRAPIGAVFLWQHAHGRMPGAFAEVAGWGDLAVGLWALAAAAWAVPPTTPGRRAHLWLWNAFGLLDILIVVLNAQRLMLWLGRRDLFDSFLALPLGAAIPMFVVPTVVLAHLVVFARLRRGRGGA